MVGKMKERIGKIVRREREKGVRIRTGYEKMNVREKWWK